MSYAEGRRAVCSGRRRIFSFSFPSVIGEKVVKGDGGSEDGMVEGAAYDLNVHKEDGDAGEEVGNRRSSQRWRR